MFRTIKIIAGLLVACALLLPAGCAKYPSSTSTSTANRQMIISVTFSGTINPNYYYFVVFNTSNDSSGAAGPAPIVSTPWGNGFVGGSATHFVEYHGSLPNDGYAVYQFVSGSSLQQYSAVGLPVQDTVVSSSSTSIEFEIPMSNLATSTIATGNISYLQMNVIATDRLPANPYDTSSKMYDAFSNYITIDTSQDATFNNSQDNVLSANGVQVTTGSGAGSSTSNPSLLITNWSVQIVG